MLDFQDVKAEITSINDRLALIENNLANINSILERIEAQTNVMENHVVNVETVISSTPFTTSLFRALNWRSIPRLISR